MFSIDVRGYKIKIKKLNIGEIKSANLSALDRAIVFGNNSPNISIIKVIIIVAYIIPSAGVTSINIFVARAEARTLTKLLANKIVQMRVSLFLKIFSKIIAFFFPVFAKVWILGFDADVNEVSEPEKNADNIIRPIIEPIKIANDKSII